MLVEPGAAMVGIPMTVASETSCSEPMGSKVGKSYLYPAKASSGRVTLVERQMLMGSLLLPHAVQPRRVLCQRRGGESLGECPVPSCCRNQTDDGSGSDNSPIEEPYKVLIASNGAPKVNAVAKSLIGVVTQVFRHKPEDRFPKLTQQFSGF